MKVKKIMIWIAVLGIAAIIFWYLRNKDKDPCVFSWTGCSNPSFSGSPTYSDPCPTPSAEMAEVLSKGDEGCKVFLLQQEITKQLKARCTSGVTSIGVDGWFGCQTQAGIRFLLNKDTASVNEIMQM